MKALVLSGGGSRGSWEAGALRYLGEAGYGGYEFISGTSVGSINAAGLAMFSPEEFAAATEHVHNLWVEKVTKTSDIWKLRFPLGIPALWNPSIGTNKQLAKLLDGLVDMEAIKASGIQLRLPAVDLETGKLYEYTVEDLEKYGIAPIMASASFPIAFPPVEIANGWMTDGGVIDMAPLGAAIAAGADEIMVLVTRDPKGVAYKSRHEMGNALKAASRILDIMTQTVLEGDLRMAEMTNCLVDTGHAMAKGKRKVDITVIGPSKPLGEALDFSGELMRQQNDQGYEDAKQYLSGNSAG